MNEKVPSSVIGIYQHFRGSCCLHSWWKRKQVLLKGQSYLPGHMEWHPRRL